jgi:hypothetical protein
VVAWAWGKVFGPSSNCRNPVTLSQVFE